MDVSDFEGQPEDADVLQPMESEKHMVSQQQQSPPPHPPRQPHPRHHSPPQQHKAPQGHRSPPGHPIHRPSPPQNQGQGQGQSKPPYSYAPQARRGKVGTSQTSQSPFALNDTH